MAMLLREENLLRINNCILSLLLVDKTKAQDLAKEISSIVSKRDKTVLLKRGTTILMLT